MKEVKIMNGFKLMSDSYKKAAEQGILDKETAEKEIRIFDFLATCDTDDICFMFDSTAFNEITMSYVKKAISELVTEDVLNDEQAVSVKNRVNCLFSETTAKEVLG